MKPATLRRRIMLMANRLEADLKRLDAWFPRDLDAGDSDPAAEANRNLATAIAWLDDLAGMNDHGLLNARKGNLD